MFVNMAIHYPRAEKEALLIAAMQRLNQALQGQPGLRYINAHRDMQRNVLVAISMWESRKAMLATVPIVSATIKDVPFDEWEVRPREIYQLNSLESTQSRSPHRSLRTATQHTPTLQTMTRNASIRFAPYRYPLSYH